MTSTPKEGQPEGTATEWEKEFDEKFESYELGTGKQIKAFILQELATARAESYRAGRESVREIVSEMELGWREYADKHTDGIGAPTSEAHGYNNALSDLLSNLDEARLEGNKPL